ncbi:MAG: hypothetical protein Q9226_004191 [Calogaya cf. arnoldii]
MGNPNRRAVPPKPVPPKPKPTPQHNKEPLPSPRPTPCPGHCGVWNRHDQDKTWTVTDKDLPTIVHVKQKALNEAMTNGNFAQARRIRGWLDHFYSWHGPYDDSALKQLPKIPPPPKRCANKSCPVRNYHHDKVYQPIDEDLPSIVEMHDDDLSYTMFISSKYNRATASRQFLVDFWNVHGGDDGAANKGIPNLPPKL